MKKPVIFLASQSERRKQLLSMIGLPFKCVSSEYQEISFSSPEKTVLTNALYKAKNAICKKDNFILGADTIVYIDNKIIGKPKDKKEAERFLLLLSGRMHTVFTGLVIIKNNKIFSGVEKTKVFFDKISKREINLYIRLCRPFDKAGAYGIQEFSSLFIRKIEGDFFNVVGLPLNLLYRLLKKARYPFFSIF